MKSVLFIILFLIVGIPSSLVAGLERGVCIKNELPTLIGSGNISYFWVDVKNPQNSGRVTALGSGELKRHVVGGEHVIFEWYDDIYGRRDRKVYAGIADFDNNGHLKCDSINTYRFISTSAGVLLR